MLVTLKSYNQGQKLLENCFLENFLFLPPSPLNNVEKQCAKRVSSYVMGLQDCIGGEGEFLDRLFKIFIIFYHWLSEICQKCMNDEILCMLFQITQICFNEPDYVTLYSVMNIMTKNGAKYVTIMVLSYYYLVPVRKGLLQAHHDGRCSLVKLLCICFYYLSLLNHG